MLIDAYHTYDIKLMSRICSTDPQSLRYWTRHHLLSPEKREHARRGAPMLFSFTELLKARVISQLRQQNVPLQRIRKALDALAGFNLANGNVYLIVNGDDIWAETDKEQILSLINSCGQLLFVNIAKQREDILEDLRLLWPTGDRGEENADN